MSIIQLTDKIAATELKWSHELVSAINELPLVTPLDAFRGVTVMISASRGGKSKAISDMITELMRHYTDAKVDVKIANFYLGEPQLDKYAGGLTYPPIRSMSEMVEVVKALKDNEVTHIFIDSIRLAQYSLSGAAAAGGMSSKTFEFLTELSMVAYDRGIALVLPFNPNVKDDVYEVVRRNIEGSVHNIIDLSDNSFVSRELDREEISFSDISDLMSKVLGSTVVQRRIVHELNPSVNATPVPQESVIERSESLLPVDATRSFKSSSNINQIKKSIR